MFEQIKTTQEGHDHEVCPNCGTEMCGGRIYEDWAPKQTAPGTYLGDKGVTAEEYAESYGAGPLAEADPERKYPINICGSQVIGIETPDYDGVSYWRYPCCGLEVDRWTRKAR